MKSLNIKLKSLSLIVASPRQAMTPSSWHPALSSPKLKSTSASVKCLATLHSTQHPRSTDTDVKSSQTKETPNSKNITTWTRKKKMMNWKNRRRTKTSNNNLKVLRKRKTSESGCKITMRNLQISKKSILASYSPRTWMKCGQINLMRMWSKGKMFKPLNALLCVTTIGRTSQLRIWWFSSTPSNRSQGSSEASRSICRILVKKNSKRKKSTVLRISGGKGIKKSKGLWRRQNGENLGKISFNKEIRLIQVVSTRPNWENIKKTDWNTSTQSYNATLSRLQTKFTKNAMEISFKTQLFSLTWDLFLTRSNLILRIWKNSVKIYLWEEKSRIS